MLLWFSDINHIYGGSYMSLIVIWILVWDMSVHFRSAYVNNYVCRVQQYTHPGVQPNDQTSINTEASI